VKSALRCLIVPSRLSWVWLFRRERPGDWADGVSPSPAAGISSSLTGLTRPASATAPNHVDVAATLLGRAG